MAKKHTVKKSQALIIRSVDLPAEKRAMISVPTPLEFIKTRPGKGGKTFTYVEGGYVIAQLNKIWSPIGWDFDVVNQEVTQQEVIIRGRLEVKDFKTGFTIGKTRTGSKERVGGVSLGDTIKAAETDALKKCASHFGIALDVYWGKIPEDIPELEETKMKKVKLTVEQKKAQEVGEAKKELAVFALSLKKVQSETDMAMLIQYKEKISASDTYTAAHKHQLLKVIEQKLKGNALF